MKRITLLVAITMATSTLFAQSPSARDGSFFNFPALRYSVCHMRQYLPTTNVPRNNSARVTQFRYRLDMEAIDRLTFIPLGQSDTVTWRKSLDMNYTDGIIILHKGRVVYERYFENLTDEGVHAVMSVTKSFTGTLAAILVEEGRLDPTKLVSYYLPELAASGFGDATVREVMDMTTAIRYSEDYTDPNAEIWAFSAAGNPMVNHPAGSPQGYHDYLKTVRKEGIHGAQFGYRTVNADVLGWIVEKVGGKSVAEQLQERFWGRMGMEQDAYYQVDAEGVPFAGGGLNAALRDLARFGQMMLQNGKWHSKQLIPEAVIEDIRFGGSAAPFAASDYGKHLPGWRYRNMWWISGNADGAYMARGVHGQAIYIVPRADVVIVRLASNPLASNLLIDPLSLPAYQAVVDYLKTK